MSPREFNDMTPVEFVHVWLMWNEMQQDKIKQAWERERWSTWILTTIQLDSKDRVSMTEMFPFPWEDTVLEPTELTLEDRRERVSELLGNTN